MHKLAIQIETKQKNTLMNTRYFIEMDGLQYGPYELSQVKEFAISADTPILIEGSETWKSASEYSELSNYFITENLNNAISANLYSSNINTTNIGAENINSETNPQIPDIFSTNFYYRIEEQLYGPFSVYELSELLDINSETILGINNTNDWCRAGSIENLMEALQLLKEVQEEKELQLKGQLEAESRRNDEIVLNNSEMKEVIEEQEKELLEKDREIERLSIPKVESETFSKDIFLDAIRDFKIIIKTEERLRYSISYPSLSNEILDKLEKYNLLKNEFIKVMNFLSRKSTMWLSLPEKDYRVKNEIISELRILFDQYNKANPPLHPEFYETAESNSPIWNNIKPQNHNSPASTFLIGQNTIEFALFDELISLKTNEYETILDSKHIVAYYDKNSKQQCFDFINTLQTRMLVSGLPSKFSSQTIDTQEMEGISNMFKSLNKSIFVYSRETEIRQCLEKKYQEIENIIQNLLLHPVTNIGEYNQGKENPEGYQFLIFKAFPLGLREDSLVMLKQIIKNGLRAGIQVILLVDKDELNATELSKRQFEAFDLNQFDNIIIPYDFTTAQYHSTDNKNIQNFLFHTLEEPIVQVAINYIKKSLENRTPDKVSFANFIPAQSEWWSKNSARCVEIPFGVSENKELISLNITQESGENSAVVIGVPGSGKSVFLHSIISNTAINYSPDELELYLMDFSGVEFNIYAINELPHAKVIAPEAEREFGISVLRELKEEGSRRMALCRDNEVSNIVDLREKRPDIKLPRQLVIIDEFQKLFEVENDDISREAMSIIHIIVKEFRKFGINLILATQKLADINSSILPKDMIANRIAFKCSPSDAGLIGMTTVPQLKTGECIYNPELGVASANLKAQTFFISKKEIESLLKQVKNTGLQREYSKKNTTVFRSDELPKFKRPAVDSKPLPAEVNIYFGDPIAISNVDIYASLKKQSNDNILIIGGEAEVAQLIAITAPLSLMAAHTEKSAKFYFFNYMRPTDSQYALPSQYYRVPAFDTVWSAKNEETMVSLTEIKTEIEARIADENLEQLHIYLNIYAFQLAQIFKKVGKYGTDLSDAGKLLEYILNKGPLVGVFTIMQVDNAANLQQFSDNALSYLSHRVALQMDEKDSRKIVESEVASKLFIMNRPHSKYRGFYFNNKNRILAKFKPYKL